MIAVRVKRSYSNKFENLSDVTNKSSLTGLHQFIFKQHMAYYNHQEDQLHIP